MFMKNARVVSTITLKLWLLRDQSMTHREHALHLTFFFKVKVLHRLAFNIKLEDILLKMCMQVETFQHNFLEVLLKKQLG